MLGAVAACTPKSLPFSHLIYATLAHPGAEGAVNTWSAHLIAADASTPTWKIEKSLDPARTASHSFQNYMCLITGRLSADLEDMVQLSHPNPRSLTTATLSACFKFSEETNSSSHAAAVTVWAAATSLACFAKSRSWQSYRGSVCQMLNATITVVLKRSTRRNVGP